MVFPWNSKEALRAGHMTRIFQALMQYLVASYYVLDFGHSALFRPLPSPGAKAAGGQGFRASNFREIDLVNNFRQFSGLSI